MPVHILMATSKDFGIEGAILSHYHINSAKFCQIYHQIRLNGEDFVSLVDNATIHTSK